MNIDRRSFVNSALVGAASALLPVRRLWADSAGSDATPPEIAARTGSGKSITLTASDIKDFDASLRGELPAASSSGVRFGAGCKNPAYVRSC